MRGRYLRSAGRLTEYTTHEAKESSKLSSNNNEGPVTSIFLCKYILTGLTSEDRPAFLPPLPTFAFFVVLVAFLLCADAEAKAEADDEGADRYFSLSTTITPALATWLT